MRSFLALIALALPLGAHVGSPDIFHEGQAGPYSMFVTVRPPSVIPGIAEIEIRTPAAGVTSVKIVPLRMVGPGSQFPPVPDEAIRSKTDAQFFTGSLWIMTSGSWQVRVMVEGDKGPGMLSIPVPALASRTLGMQWGMGAGLIALGLILSVGAVSIVGAAVREGTLEPGVEADPSRRSKARVRMAVTAVAVVGVLWASNQWWSAEAANYERILYKPLDMSAQVAIDDTLQLQLSSAGWFQRLDDLIADHGHLMHLYVIALPLMNQVWHLHPELSGTSGFTQKLPAMKAGKYALYADIVHANGFPETLVSTLDLKELKGHPLEGDDATGSGPAFGSAGPSFQFADGAKLVWTNAGAVKTKQITRFEFRLEDDAGIPAEGMELYMGMQGHAAFVRDDRTVFAHVHPTGSVAMAAVAIANKNDPHAGHTMLSGKLPAAVGFPYGVPKPGKYRLFVQMKQQGKVRTGFFDFDATE